MVVCSHCAFNSVDPAFCDRCRHDLRGGGDRLPARVTLADGRSVDCSAWHGAWPADAWRPLAPHSARPFRLYALGPGWWRDLGPAIRARVAVRLAGLAPLEVVPVGEGAIVVASVLPGARKALPLPPGRADDLAHLDSLLDTVRSLVAALRPLHEAGYVWLNFDPDALEEGADEAPGSRGLQIANLDLQLFRAGECPDNLRLTGRYSSPEACQFRAERIGRRTDVFHVSAYAYYRLAGLLPNGFPGQGLEAFEFEVPPLRIYRPSLPIGVAPVLARGLARDPDKRFASVSELQGALEEAVARARRRATFVGPLRWEADGLTVPGQTKSALGRANQDTVALLPPPAPELGPIVIVADGVTHCRIGSGDLASETANSVLAAELPRRLAAVRSREETEEALRDSCLEASASVLRRALALGPLPPGTERHDLMCSTAVVGVLRERALALANVGDSRAYLIADGQAEQLTVDGDVTCTELGRGAAPEEVRALGGEGLSLYFCLGVAEPGPFGTLRCCVERSTPQVTHWPLLPGDIVVFCTDGLVEEGIFLAPHEIADVIRARPELAAGELAELLVGMANARQRLPSPAEPEGCGDNISCVVLKILAVPDETAG